MHDSEAAFQNSRGEIRSGSQSIGEVHPVQYQKCFLYSMVLGIVWGNIPYR